MLTRLLKLSFVPASTDLALLVLRVCAGVSLFLRHGWEKATGFDGVVARVPDFLHIGVGTMIFLAAVGDVLCSLLVAVGLAVLLRRSSVGRARMHAGHAGGAGGDALAGQSARNAGRRAHARL